MASDNGLVPCCETQCGQQDICLQAAFPNAGLHRQHLDSAAHKKALAKQERDREQAERLSRGRDAAENAVVGLGGACSGCCGCSELPSWIVSAVDC